MTKGVKMCYSFNQYSEEIKNTRQGTHNTLAYNCLGLIGELGELIEKILECVLPDSEDELEEEILYELIQFATAACRAESLKKRIRKMQIQPFSHALIPQGGVNAEELQEELGDVLWYLDTLASNMKTSLAAVAYQNQAKLEQRFLYNPGWLIDG